jgi:hypothetical protein
LADKPTADAHDPIDAHESSVTRESLELVIRRAIDLSVKEKDAQDAVSEDELVKIGEELGLSPRHVRQALYERSRDDQPESGFLDRNFGPTSVVVARAVPCDVPLAHRRLEDHLVTREYLQIRRRQGPNALFEPADDAFSSLARVFSRPSSRFSLARVQRAYLTVRPLESGWCHVRMEMTYPERRSSHVIGATVGGTLVGLAIGAGAAGGIAIAMGGLNDPGTALTALVGGAIAGGGSFAGMWSLVRASYRKWIARTKDEADAILDRLELGDDLRPPASPWLRRLQQKLRGFGPRNL